MTIEDLKISYQSDSFKHWFGGMTFDYENTDPVFETLPKSMTDSEILDEIKPQEATLGELGYLIDENKLSNAWWYIFYIRDNAGVLRAVNVFWRGDGWYVSAYSVEDPSRWDGGDQVFSRNSLKLSPSDTLSLDKAIEKVKEAGYVIYKKV